MARQEQNATVIIATAAGTHMFSVPYGVAVDGAVGYGEGSVGNDEGTVGYGEVSVA